MLNRFMPKEGKFFALFNQHADLTVAAARELVKLFGDFDHARDYIDSIKELEKKADRITFEIIDLLHKTFITPLERDDILKLATTLDDVIDLMEDVTEIVALYEVKQTSEQAQQLTQIILKGTERIQQSVKLLENMKNAPEMLRISAELERLESEGDRVMRDAISRLFREEDNVKDLIKYKAIYETLETITDKCEDMGNIIQGIVVENA